MKTKQPPKILELKISLLHTSPLVWRKVLVHDFIELEELNLLIQICMGWENCHLHDFVINKKTCLLNYNFNLLLINQSGDHKITTDIKSGATHIQKAINS